ncbi:MAG: hypothetical protein Ta2A_16130 [Treponemataceae bacterium]|nr:MAG: hypothetical protein Ta2A_16130 [Treponemataceae bacterium]
MINNRVTDLIRVGIFYDGYYFYKVSNYYKYEHDKRARISISGLHKFIRNEVAIAAGCDIRQCQIIDAHYFKGRSSAKDLGDKVQSERVFEDILMRENIVTHYLPLRYTENNQLHEKGIDVWLALEAYELAIYKNFDVLVLIACDGDYVPLVRKLNTLGTQVMLLSWNFSYHTELGGVAETRTSRQLMEEVLYPLDMAGKIDTNTNDEFIKNLFVEDRYSDANAGQGRVRAKTVPQTDDEDDDAFEFPQIKSSDEAGHVSIIQSINPGGFGFIRDEAINNVFFHFSNVTNKNFEELTPGMKVKYYREEDEDRTKREGAIRYRAFKVTVIDDDDKTNLAEYMV